MGTTWSKLCDFQHEPTYGERKEADPRRYTRSQAEKKEAAGAQGATVRNLRALATMFVTTALLVDTPTGARLGLTAHATPETRNLFNSSEAHQNAYAGASQGDFASAEFNASRYIVNVESLSLFDFPDDETPAYYVMQGLGEYRYLALDGRLNRMFDKALLKPSDLPELLALHDFSAMLSSAFSDPGLDELMKQNNPLRTRAYVDRNEMDAYKFDQALRDIPHFDADRGLFELIGKANVTTLFRNVYTLQQVAPHASGNRTMFAWQVTPSGHFRLKDVLDIVKLWSPKTFPEPPLQGSFRNLTLKLAEACSFGDENLALKYTRLTKLLLSPDLHLDDVENLEKEDPLLYVIRDVLNKTDDPISAVNIQTRLVDANLVSMHAFTMAMHRFRKDLNGLGGAWPNGPPPVDALQDQINLLMDKTKTWTMRMRVESVCQETWDWCAVLGERSARNIALVSVLFGQIEAKYHGQKDSTSLKTVQDVLKQLKQMSEYIDDIRAMHPLNATAPEATPFDAESAKRKINAIRVAAETAMDADTAATYHWFHEVAVKFYTLRVLTNWFFSMSPTEDESRAASFVMMCEAFFIAALCAPPVVLSVFEGKAKFTGEVRKRSRLFGFLRGCAHTLLVGGVVFVITSPVLHPHTWFANRIANLPSMMGDVRLDLAFHHLADNNPLRQLADTWLATDIARIPPAKLAQLFLGGASLRWFLGFKRELGTLSTLAVLAFVRGLTIGAFTPANLFAASGFIWRMLGGVLEMVPMGGAELGVFVLGIAYSSLRDLRKELANWMSDDLLDSVLVLFVSGVLFRGQPPSSAANYAWWSGFGSTSLLALDCWAERLTPGPIADFFNPRKNIGPHSLKRVSRMLLLTGAIAFSLPSFGLDHGPDASLPSNVQRGQLYLHMCSAALVIPFYVPLYGVSLLRRMFDPAEVPETAVYASDQLSQLMHQFLRAATIDRVPYLAPFFPENHELYAEIDLERFKSEMDFLAEAVNGPPGEVKRQYGRRKISIELAGLFALGIAMTAGDHHFHTLALHKDMTSFPDYVLSGIYLKVPVNSRDASRDAITWNVDFEFGERVQSHMKKLLWPREHTATCIGCRVRLKPEVRNVEKAPRSLFDAMLGLLEKGRLVDTDAKWNCVGDVILSARSRPVVDMPALEAVPAVGAGGDPPQPAPPPPPPQQAVAQAHQEYRVEAKRGVKDCAKELVNTFASQGARTGANAAPPVELLQFWNYLMPAFMVGGRRRRRMQ